MLVIMALNEQGGLCRNGPLTFHRVYISRQIPTSQNYQSTYDQATITFNSLKIVAITFYHIHYDNLRQQSSLPMSTSDFRFEQLLLEPEPSPEHARDYKSIALLHRSLVLKHSQLTILIVPFVTTSILSEEPRLLVNHFPGNINLTTLQPYQPYQVIPSFTPVRPQLASPTVPPTGTNLTSRASRGSGIRSV